MGKAVWMRLGSKGSSVTGTLPRLELMSSSPLFGAIFSCLARAQNESIGSCLIRMPRA